MKIKETDIDVLELPSREKIRRKRNKSGKPSRNDKSNKPQRGKRDKFMYLTF